MAAPVVDEVVLETDLAAGFEGGPQFGTRLIEMALGQESRAAGWPGARYRYRADATHRSRAELAALEAFFLCRDGDHRGFLFRDDGDFEVSFPTPTVPVTPAAFQLVKRYSSGGVERVRTITRPDPATVTLYDAANAPVVGGWTVDAATGVVTFGSAPGFVPKATFQFRVPVRFDGDRMERSLQWAEWAEWSGIGLVEITDSPAGGVPDPGPAATADGTLGVPIDEERLPEDLSGGFTGGPHFQTPTVVTRDGREQRFRRGSGPRYRYRGSFHRRDRARLETLEAFMQARRGRERGFRLRDWGDWEVTTPTATLPVNVSYFRLAKRYTSGAQERARAIYKPVAGSVRVFDDTDAEVASGWTVDSATGLLFFTSPPAYTPRATFQFDVPVRFDTDAMARAMQHPGWFDWPEVHLVELRPVRIL